MRVDNFRSVNWCLPPLLLLLAGNCLATACNVPVFRYALERWQAAPYRLTLLHDGTLGEADAARVTELMQQGEATAKAIAWRTLDVAVADDEADRALIASAKHVALPSVAIQYPYEFGRDEPFWVISWDSTSVKKIVDSPLRASLAQRLAAGQTAVWLVLLSGDSQKDEAVTAMLTQELKRLATELELPEQDGEDPSGVSFEGPPLRIEFSILPVPREGVDEGLVAMLLHSEPDLSERTDPLVFPVFGRGRALFPLVGAGITPPNIADYAEFMVGACSCEVKEQNPGFDLLLTADWDHVLRGAGQKPSAPEIPTSKVTHAPQLVDIPRGSDASHNEAPPAAQSTPSALPSLKPGAGARNIIPWLTGIAAIGLVVMLVAWRRRLIST